MDRPDDERTLVLGDFSPKNILVHAGGLILLDFECAHAGDPAFDLGFFLSHLLLKAIRTSANDFVDYDDFIALIESFWTSYLDRQGLAARVRADLVRRANRHTAACCLARVDGKSPVEYLDAAGQALARSFAREALRIEPASWEHLLGYPRRDDGDVRSPHDHVEGPEGSPGARLARSADRGSRGDHSTGAVGRAIVPSGASTGRHEAIELRDAENPRYGGLGVLKAVENVTRVIAPAVAGIDLDDQAGLDARLIALDGTPNKSRLGANAVLGVSLAVAHAAAAARGEELFVHLNRLWNEPDRIGKLRSPPGRADHAAAHGQHDLRRPACRRQPRYPGRPDHPGRRVQLQRGPGDDRRALSRHSARVLKETGFESALVGDEGGYGPRLRDNEQAFEVVVDAIVACGFEPGRDVAIAVDVASTHFFDPDRGTYRLHADAATGSSTPRGMIDLLAGWVERYPIVSIEDGLAEDDWDGWTALTARLGGSVQLIGDDLFATQVDRLRQGIDRRAGNAVLIKLNQVGTLTETLDALRLARQHGFRTIVSARSGETEDATIADLAVATAAGQIKIGSVARSERLAKYNRLLRIEEALGADARLARPFAM